MQSDPKYAVAVSQRCSPEPRSALLHCSRRASRGDLSSYSPREWLFGSAVISCKEVEPTFHDFALAQRRGRVDPERLLCRSEEDDAPLMRRRCIRGAPGGEEAPS